MYRLDNPIRAYEWGSETAIAQILGREPSQGPEAEMWIGAHPDSPSTARMPDGASMPLDELVGRDAVAALGAPAVRRFGPRLPFLAKVLAAEKALSLQVHPTLAQAAEGYAAEESAGVPRAAPHRNFKDPSHKPETVVALSRFEALCGFRDPGQAATLYLELRERFDGAGEPVPKAIPDVLGLLGHPSPREALRGAFTYLLDGGGRISEAAEAAVRVLGMEQSPPGPALTAVAELGRTYPGDPGVLVSLLLNHVILEPGQALFLPAGNIHAYLHGLGFEVMAASDNVLRGGLTNKHIDIPLLLETVDFSPLPVPLLLPEATSPDTLHWSAPAEEFQLEQFTMAPGEHGPAKIRQNGPVIVLVLQGTARITTSRGECLLTGGHAVLIPADESPATIAPGADAKPLTAFAVTIGEPLR